MFSIAAVVGMVAIVWLADRANRKDPATLDDRGSYDMIRYSRQDLRLIAWLLASILVALGIIADRIH